MQLLQIPIFLSLFLNPPLIPLPYNFLQCKLEISKSRQNFLHKFINKSNLLPLLLSEQKYLISSFNKLFSSRLHGLYRLNLIQHVLILNSQLYNFMLLNCKLDNVGEPWTNKFRWVSQLFRKSGCDEVIHKVRLNDLQLSESNVGHSFHLAYNGELISKQITKNELFSKVVFFFRHCTNCVRVLNLSGTDNVCAD